MIAMPAENQVAFGPQQYGAELLVDTTFEAWPWNQVPTSVDVETDEKDNFVGLAICQDDKRVFYFSKLTDHLKKFLGGVPIIGHNVKFDLKLLIKWGVDLNVNSLHFDTCLASYVQNTTKDTHHLKDLAHEYLGMTWPTYREMVGSGQKKITLDKQPVNRVAAYCGMDSLATYKLYQYFLKKLNPQQRHILEVIELPTARILMEMEMKGAMIDVPYIETLDKEFKIKMDSMIGQVYEQWIKYNPRQHKPTCVFKRGRCAEHPVPRDLEFNINSNDQIANLLEHMGAVLPKTDKGNRKVDKGTLENWRQIPIVPLLLDYSKIEKLYSTYTQGLLERNQNGRIHTSFNQITKNEDGNEVGISTNRLSSSNPNLQNIPTRTDEGKLIRRAFVAPSDALLIDADYSQIEYRLLAHFSGEPRLIKAFQEGKDVHEETGNALGVSRDLGKTLNFASIYGAQAGKISRTAKISEEDAERFLASYWKVLPRVTAWVMRTKYEARMRRGVFTLHRRWIPLPGIMSQNRYERMHWERAAVNYVIQGSAAEIMKLALIKLKQHSYLPVLTVHDEFLFEDDGVPTEVDEHAGVIKHLMESVATLSVPLVADVGIGENWDKAKE